jgi:ATP-grasp domain, R2K clade family 3
MMTKKVTLVLEKTGDFSSLVFASQIEKIKTAAEGLSDKIELFETSRDRINQITEIPDRLIYEPTIVYGSLQFVRDIKRPLFPGAYAYNNTDWITVSSNLPRELFFNHDYHITTWGDFCKNINYWEKTIGTNFFIRPVSDKKIFAGQAILAAFSKATVLDIHQTTSVTKETLILVTSSKPIHLEFRFFIVDRQVVTWSKTPSEYSYATWPKPHFDACFKLAKFIATLDWQPDTCYTCDITYVNSIEKAKIVEFNSFCSAGVYDCDVNVLLERVAQAALSDYYP